MKILKTSDITASIAMPVKKGTLDHIQAAYKEGMDAIAKAFINFLGIAYNASNFYILHGCANSGTGSDYNISAGAIFYNGEIYLVDATTFTAAGGETCVGIITTTYFAADEADPVTFTDGILRNVHEIRKIVFASGVSGSGDVDFADLVYSNTNSGSGTVTTGTFTEGTATIDTFDYDYVRQGNLVTMSIIAAFDITAGDADNGITFKTSVLPFSMDPAYLASSVGYVHKTIGFTYLAGRHFGFGYIRALTNQLEISIPYNIVSTNNYVLNGQIVFKVL